jgi:hypothetical protein
VILSNSLRSLAAALGHLLLWCCFAAAQPADSLSTPNIAKPANRQATAAVEKPSAEEPSAAHVEESRPSVYYLPDKQGNLQPVLDFTYQDFVDLYKLKNQLGRRDEPPRYTLQRMTATGSAAEEYAELNVQFQVLVHDDGWVRIPLRLDQGLLRGAVNYKGPGEQFLRYEGNAEGYVCWLRGKNDTQHEISLTLLVPLAAMGDETRLKLFIPRATASELKLTVPLADAVAKVSEGATLLPSAPATGGGAAPAAQPPPAAPHTAPRTELSVAGLGGEFFLAWHKPNLHAVETPLVLEASGVVLTRFDSRSISADATLSVRSYGAAFDRFTVRLPPRAELVPETTSAYIVTPVEADAKRPTQSRLVAVQLPKKTIGPVEVRLACRRNYDPLKDRSWCEVAGFEVVGAARQWGTAAVAAVGDWQLLWGTSSEVRQSEQLPESLRREDVVTGFEYSVQPYSLTARLTPRKTRVTVDPKYVLLVDRNVVRLEGKLTYTIRGARIAALDVAVPGWELDEIGPDNLVALDGVTHHDNKIAVALARPSSGTLELHLRAHRAADAKAGSLSIALPQPQANSVGLASVVVVPADNVELTPDTRRIEGLARQRTAPQTPQRLPERQQEPLYYRGTGGPALFAADFHVHAQTIAVDVATQVSLGQRTAEVEQRQSYTIAYEPVDRLTIGVPRALAAAKRIAVLCDGKPLLPAAVIDEPAGNGAAGPVSMRVALPRPRIGSCELVLQYSTAVGEPTPQHSSSLDLPLPMPQDGQLMANSLTVKASRNTRVSPRKESAWTVVQRTPAASGSQNALRLTAAKKVYQLDANLRWEADDTAGATIVDRAWVQSWFNSSQRQDRAAYQLTTNRQELEVRFPPGAAADQAVVLVGGKRVQARTVAEDRLLVPLPGPREDRRFMLELLYYFPGPRSPRGALSISFPHIGPDVWVRRMYWQLVLPTNEHVVANPAGFTGEFSWGWHGYFWGRQPLLDQSQLESWVGAAPQAPLPERANLYLYSALGDVQEAELHTATRTWIVLWASGAALVAGLLLIYVPASRRPATLLAVGLALLAAGLVAPEPTFLLAQAASLGLALTLLAGLLQRGVSRRRRTAAHKEPSHARIELGSTHSPYRAPPANAQGSTETLPVVQPPSPGDANP